MIRSASHTLAQKSYYEPRPTWPSSLSHFSSSSFWAHKKRQHKTNNPLKSQYQNQPTMKITYIIGTLLLLASMAMAYDKEDPKKDRHLRTTKNTPGLGRGGKRTLETKQRPQTLGSEGKRTLAVKTRPPELQTVAATKGAMSSSKHGNPNSCQGHCNGNAGNCYCDDDCHEFGDCCNDVCQKCNLPNCQQPFSCHGNCGGQAPGGCWCDSACSIPPYDCCADVCHECYIDC